MLLVGCYSVAFGVLFVTLYMYLSKLNLFAVVTFVASCFLGVWANLDVTYSFPSPRQSGLKAMIYILGEAWLFSFLLPRQNVVTCPLDLALFFSLLAGEVTINSATAHPHQTSDGSVINISSTYGRDSTYKIIQIPPSSGKADEKPLEGGKVLCTISPTSGLGYFHSFCLTDNYVVVTEQPLMINIWRALTHRFFSSGFENWLYWDANQLVRFHIIDRKDGNRVGVFTAEPFFVFHHINAFERDEKIYLDACCYHDNSIIKQLYLKNLRSPAEPGQKKLDVPDVRRYEIPLGQLYDAKTEKPLHKGSDGLDYSSLYSGIDLPRINYEEFNGKPYR